MLIKHDEWSQANRRAAEDQYIQGIRSDSQAHTLVLRAAALVYDGNQAEIGNLKGVLVDPHAGALRDLLISRPGPMKSRIRVPALGCNFANAGEIYLTGALPAHVFTRRSAPEITFNSSAAVEFDRGG
jgi:hypothetical protein